MAVVFIYHSSSSETNSGRKSNQVRIAPESLSLILDFTTWKFEFDLNSCTAEQVILAQVGLTLTVFDAPL